MLPSPEAAMRFVGAATSGSDGVTGSVVVLSHPTNEISANAHKVADSLMKCVFIECFSQLNNTKWIKMLLDFVVHYCGKHNFLNNEFHFDWVPFLPNCFEVN